jgi:hypothetical protein
VPFKLKPSGFINFFLTTADQRREKEGHTGQSRTLVNFHSRDHTGLKKAAGIVHTRLTGTNIYPFSEIYTPKRQFFLKNSDKEGPQ